MNASGTKERVMDVMSSESMIKCGECGGMIARTAPMCPHCGAKTKVGRVSETWTAISILSLTIACATFFICNDSDFSCRNSRSNVPCPEPPREVMETKTRLDDMGRRAAEYVAEHVRKEKEEEGRKNQERWQAILNSEKLHRLHQEAARKYRESQGVAD